MDKDTLSQLIRENFPLSGLNLAFGYGSRIVKQKKITGSNDLADLIFAVDNSTKWHQDNLIKNRSHYSFLCRLPQSANAISEIQEKYGARVYFNPYVNLGGILNVKYGIIKTDHLLEDLNSWRYLYTAGRLHKPVEYLLEDTCSNNEAVKAAIRFNKESATRAALLQLPEIFSVLQLYLTITALSYKGDLRMIFGEDKDKVHNIVSNQIERFQKMYLPEIRTNQSFRDCVTWDETKQQFTQDTSPASSLKHLKALPSHLRKTICKIHEPMARTLDADAVLASASRSINCNKLVEGALMSIVRRSSLSQSIKGLFTAGLIKSVRYSQRKLIKSFASRSIIS